MKKNESEYSNFGTVDHPIHYNFGKIECIEALESLATPMEYGGFLRLNAIKYLWRFGQKGNNPIEDLEKAKWYINRLIKMLSGEKNVLKEKIN